MDSTTVALVITLVVGIFGSTGLFSLIQYLIKRKDDKTDRLTEIEEKLDGIMQNQERGHRNSLRAQLLMLMASYPDMQEEILKVSKKYFVDLGGDWYISSLFNRWLQERHITPPLWFNESDKEGE